MKNNLLTTCCIFVFLTIINLNLKGGNGDENFCFDADVPAAQDNLAAMCLTAPTLFCPPTYLGCPNDNLDPNNTGYPTALPGDAACPDPIVSFTDVVVQSTACLTIIHRTWEATYPPGSASLKLHSTCQQTLYLEDNSIPVINNCPSDIVIDLSADCDSTAVWAVPTAEDDCGIQLFTTTHFSGTAFPSGTTAVTYTAQDYCGNQSTCSFNVTVTGSCCSSPTIACPVDVVRCPVTGNITPSSTGVATATASDASCPAPTVSYTDNIVSSGPCLGAQEIDRLWTATDGSFTTSCTQRISVIDNTNPVITNTPSNITITGSGNNCQVAATWNAPLATDNCDLASWTSNYDSGDLFTEGVTTVIYTAVDNCGNTATSSFTVTIICVCNTAPVITCPANYFSCPTNPSTSPSVTGVATATVADANCGTPNVAYTDVVVSTGPCTGETLIQRTWTATIANNNSLTTECLQTITISDNSVPSITNIPADLTVSGTGANCSVPATWTVPTATDDCGIASLTSNHNSGSSFNSGVTTVSYTATDNCGHTSVATFTVTVSCATCNTPPILNCPADYTGCPTTGYPEPSFSGTATATNSGTNCSGAPLVTYTDVVNSNGSCANAYNITRTWTATNPNDASLFTTCTQEIVLTDNGGPSITNIPADITVHGNGSNCNIPVKWAAPQVNDDCGVASFNSTHDPGDIFSEGTTTVIYTATDNCGNSIVETFTVTVDCLAGCSTPPSISCPANLTSCPGGMLPSPSVAGVANASPGSAACGTPFVFYSDFISMFGACSGSYVANRTWTAFDPSNGLSSSCVQVIQLDDNTPPAIGNLPQNITVEGTGSGCLVNVNWQAPSATDNCGIASLTSNFSRGTTFSEGTSTVIYTATDNCGNTSTASFTVTVNCAGCSTPPSITCPADYITCPNGAFPTPSVAGLASATAGSADCGTPSVTYNDTMDSFGNCAGAVTYQRTWTAYDPSNSALTATCVQMISLEDNQNPVISNLPQNISVTAGNGSCLAPVTWNIPSASDDCGISSLTSNYQSGHSFGEGSTTVIYTATDNCGNSVTGSFLVTVDCMSCDTPPAISCPSNYTACAGNSSDPSFTGFATGTNVGANCTGTPYVVYNDIITSTGPCAGESVIQRTWTATNNDNNLSSSCVQTIILADNSQPVITNVPSNISVTGAQNNCLVPVTWNTPTVTDACGTATLTSNYASGTTFSQGTTTIIYTATDNCGNTITASFTVTVTCEVCTTPPSITCPADYTTCATGAGLPNPIVSGFAYSVIDGPYCSGTPYMTYNDFIVSTGTCAGAMEIERTWIATDPSNKLQSNCIQHISLVDNSMPVIANVPADIVLNGSGSNCQLPASWNAPTATDDCGIASLTASHASGTLFSSGTTTVTYTATDDCGNVTTASFTVSVVCAGCNTPPAIACPSNYTACITGPTGSSVTGVATASNLDPNCTAIPAVTFSDVVTSTGPCAGAQVVARTWTASDPSTGLTSSCVQTITLNDNNNPVIYNMPMNITINATGTACTAVASWNAPTATDDCGIVNISCPYTSGSVFHEGTTTVTYTATDNCGNTSVASFTVTVVCAGCNTAPVIICPNNYTACITGPTGTSATGVATATNPDANCTSVPAITYTDAVTSSGPCAGAQVVARTWTASDSSTGLNSSCVQTITLSDNTNPVIYNMPTNVTVTGTGSACSAAVTWNVPTATDDCGIVYLSATHSNGDVFTEGTTTVTYTATDNCGNTSIATFTVTVACAGCSTAPIITCPADYSACIAGPTSTSASGVATASNPNVNCTTTPVITYTDAVISTGPCAGAQEVARTWTATDPETGLSSSCIQNLSIADNTDPTIYNMPTDITVTGNGAGCAVPVTWNVPTATDNCGPATLTCDYINGYTFTEGSTTVTYTAADPCGNTTIATFTITVVCQVCNTVPTLACPVDYISCPMAGVPSTAVSGQAIANASGAHCGTPVITYNDVITSTGLCQDAKEIERTWTATDPNNVALATSCVQLISLVDNTAPTLVNCPVGLVIQGMTSMTGSGTGSGMGGGTICSGVAVFTPPTASDDCSTTTVICTDQDGNVVNSGDTFEAGVTIVTCTATDLCGNEATCAFDILVTCSDDCDTMPLLTCPSDATVCIGADYSVAALGAATAVGGANCPTPVVNHADVLISSGPCAGAAIYERTWTTSYPNIMGSEVSCVQTITISNPAPTFTTCPENIIVGDDATPVIWTAPTLVDACGTATVTSTHTSGATFACGTTTVTYSATNACGDITECSFDVIVECVSGGGFAYCPSDITLSCGGNGGAYANWNMPIYNNSCSDCSIGLTIPGFIYMGTYGGSQYYCSVSPATWPVAKNTCVANGGYLADVNSAGENSFLANMLTTQSAWIGLTDVNSEGTFEWCNGQPVTYTNWYTGQPNNYNNNQDYCEMLSTGEWNDQYNSYALEYIMEIPCNYVSQIAGPAPGTFLAGGTYTVTYGVTDACNTNETCSFTITVEEALEMTCPADITVTAAPGAATATVSWDEPTATSCCSSCSGNINGFVYMGSFQGHHYYCSVGTDTWANAKATCSANGGYLASINNAAENAYLANILTLQSAWIGASDLNTEGSFEWCDGAPFGYTNWYPGQPNDYNGAQDCIEMLNNGQWNDQYGYYLLEYIMEIPDCISMTQVAGPAAGSSFATGSTTTITYDAVDGCGNTATCSFDVTVEAGSNNTLCTSGGAESTYHYINSCTFGNLNNVSGDDGGYGDYTNICETIEPSQVVPLQLCPAFGGQKPHVMYWSVWIDFNQDGDFYDNYEFVAYGAGSQCLNGNVTIPPNVLNGYCTMRVSCKLGGYATDPCEAYLYGETEDYCIQVINGSILLDEDVIESRAMTTDDAVELEEETTEIIVENIDVAVYPNPVSNIMNVTISDIDQVVEVNLYSQGGSLVTPLDIDHEISVDVSDLPSGMYVVKALQQNGRVTSEKVIIMH